ncbi:MAG: FtsX-like permease family protein [Oligoflexus sp.]
MLAKFAWYNVKRNRRRSIVSISSIAMSVFGLFFLDSFFTGLIRMHHDNAVRSRFGHGQVHTQGYVEKTYEKPWEHWIEEPAKVEENLLSHEQIDRVFPRVQFFALLSNGTTSVAGRGQGIVGKDEQDFFNRMNFIDGGVIGDTADGLVLGTGLAKTLNVGVGDPVTIISNTVHGSINAIDVTVTGIFHMGFKEADDMLFQVQLEQAHILLDTQKVESFAIAAHPEHDWSNISSYVEQNIVGMEALSVNILDKVWAENGSKFLTALLNIFRFVFMGIILLSIYNSSSTTILERTREFAMLRSNGESSKDLIVLTLMESGIIAIIGGSIGIIMTMSVSLLFPEGIPMPPTPGTNRELPVKISLEIFRGSFAWGLGTIASLMATFIAALQILSLSIAKGLKSAG